MRPVVTIVELDRPAGEIQGLLAQEEPVVPGEAGPFVQVRHGEPDIGARELGILRHRLLEAATRLADRREIGAFQGAPAAQPEIVGHQIVRPCALGRLEARIFDAADQHRDDAARHLVLDVEELAHRAIVALRPELTGGVGLDQPHGDPDVPARTPEGAFEHVRRAELGPHAIRRHGGIAVGQGRARRDHVELAKPAELGRDVLRHADAEMAAAGRRRPP